MKKQKEKEMEKEQSADVLTEDLSELTDSRFGKKRNMFIHVCLIFIMSFESNQFTGK